MATRDLDRIDRKILETLQLDGRITNQDLSTRISLSPRACLERVRRLERAGIIAGYMALVEPRKLGDAKRPKTGDARAFRATRTRSR